MNNDKCILVEFANEDNSIAVGFQDWLVKDKDSEDLKTIVKNKTLVEILWPSCEIKSAQQMKKIVKSLTKKDWITSAVRILAYGGMFPNSILYLGNILRTYGHPKDIRTT